VGGSYRLPSVINCGADEDAFFDQDVYASVGNLSFDLFNLFFSDTGGRVNPYMAVLILEAFRSRFDSGTRAELFGQQAQLGEAFVNKDATF
jgi:hypothetical protein